MPPVEARGSQEFDVTHVQASLSFLHCMDMAGEELQALAHPN